MRQRLRAVRAQQGTDGGFTLTELLIVIVILGVLTGIVVFAVGAFTDRGETAACNADKRSVESALEAYRAQNDAYPAANDWNALTTGGYLRSAPSTGEYTITFTAAGAVSGDIVGGAVTQNCTA
jgi:general secretion pathway protein G